MQHTPEEVTRRASIDRVWEGIGSDFCKATDIYRHWQLQFQDVSVEAVLAVLRRPMRHELFDGHDHVPGISYS